LGGYIFAQCAANGDVERDERFGFGDQALRVIAYSLAIGICDFERSDVGGDVDALETELEVCFCSEEIGACEVGFGLAVGTNEVDGKFRSKKSAVVRISESVYCFETLRK
jgi:hypothetical protein